MKDNATYIHRGEFRPDRDPNDLTSFIRWDYMGSSEFEFYAFPHTFKLMRSLPRTSERYYSEDELRFYGPRQERNNTFRPFFLTSNQTAAELFLARVAS